MKRYALLKCNVPGYDSNEYVFVADAEAVTDSAFLHYILSVSDPGDDYSVRFTYTKPRLTRGRDYWSHEGRSGGFDFTVN